MEASSWQELSYEELAQLTLAIGEAKSQKITGGDIKKLTLMFCTQLTAGRYPSITKDVATTVIGKYLDDIQENTPQQPKEEEVREKDLSNTVLNELNN